MTGRDFFSHYAGLVNFLVSVAKLFPKGFRKQRLSAACMVPGGMGHLRRYVWLSSLAKHVGKNVAVFPCVFFEHVDRLSIGDNVSIHQMCYIDACGGIDIGNDVSIAHRTTVLSSNHAHGAAGVPIKYQGMVPAKTTIDDNVWIGCSATVLAGAHIHSGAVVGANSVVTKDVASDTVVVGNPARFLKSRLATAASRNVP